MEWTIYSIGSAVYLEEILNAVAMISGTGDIESLAKIGLLIGTLILAFQAVFNGTGIQFQKLLVCFIMYLAMYGPTATALIEDVYTKEVAVVDNVPLGPLAVGSILSNIGYKITELFETAFSTPSMTSYGFADPLTALIKVRKAANNVISLPSFSGGGASASLLSSWSNYIKECTLVAANNDERALIRMLNAPEAVNALNFDSQVYYTKIYDGVTDGRTLTCSDAFVALRNMTEGKTDDLMDDVAKSFASTSANPTGVDIEARVNDALITLAGGVVDARNYAVMSAVLPILEGAPGERAITDMQGAAAIMMSQAMQQQNTQWAAEGSMFTKYIRPFMTFFEGFIYAITPLMAFVIVLGGFGIGLVSKYLMILIWMTLWMPVLAIVNLYTISTTKAKIEVMTGTTSFGSDGLSFNSLRDMLPVIEAQLGVAGMMASSVPALCMFLVYGTSVAASGIASRLNGSDTINEKISSPDIVQPGAGLSMSSQASHDPARGARGTGSEELRPSINTGSALESAVQSSKSNLQSSSMAYNQAFQKQLAQSVGNSSSLAQTAELGNQFANATGLSNSSDFKTASAAAYAAGYSKDDVAAFVAAKAAGTQTGLSLGGGTPGPVKAGGQMGANTSNTNTTSNQQSSSQKVENSRREAIEAQLSSAVANQFSAQKSTGTAERLSNSQEFSNNASFSDALSQQKSDLQQSQKSYAQTQAFKDSYGMQTSTSIDALANSVVKNGKAGELVGSLDKLDDADRGLAYERYESFKKANGTTMGNANAEAGAAIYALASTGNYDKLGEALNLPLQPINPNENSDLAAVGNNGIEEAYNSRGMASPSYDPNVESQRIQAAGSAAVNEARELGRAQVSGDFVKGAGTVSNENLDMARSKLSDSGNGLTYDQMMQSADRGNPAMGRIAEFGGMNQTQLDAKFDEFKSEGLESGLPEPLAHAGALARIGHFQPSDMDHAVEAMEHQYNMDTNTATGAVSSAIHGSLSRNDDGGSHYADIHAAVNDSSNADILMSYHPR